MRTPFTRVRVNWGWLRKLRALRRALKQPNKTTKSKIRASRKAFEDNELDVWDRVGLIILLSCEVDHILRVTIDLTGPSTRQWKFTPLHPHKRKYYNLINTLLVQKLPVCILTLGVHNEKDVKHSLVYVFLWRSDSTAPILEVILKHD